MATVRHPAWAHITREITDDDVDEAVAAGWIADKPQEAETRWPPRAAEEPAED